MPWSRSVFLFFLFFSLLPFLPHVQGSVQLKQTLLMSVNRAEMNVNLEDASRQLAAADDHIKLDWSALITNTHKINPHTHTPTHTVTCRLRHRQTLSSKCSHTHRVSLTALLRRKIVCYGLFCPHRKHSPLPPLAALLRADLTGLLLVINVSAEVTQRARASISSSPLQKKTWRIILK